MLDRQLLRDDPERVKQGALRKGIAAPVDEFLEVDRLWRKSVHEADVAKGEMNQIAKSIGALMQQGQKEQAELAKQQAATLKESIQKLEEEQRVHEEKLREIELTFPNLPHESIPDGGGPDDNVVVREWGEKLPQSKQHFDIALELGIIDFERATKISGSGFAVYRGLGAKLQRALLNWMLDYHERGDYHEVWAPYIVNSQSMYGTGNLPKFADDLYHATDDMWLIPTAEVSLTNLFRDEILTVEDLPKRICGYSACFRRESGAAGRETRGIQRMHQFDKVELVWFTKPEDSYAALETLTSDAEGMLKELGLAHRVIELCAGDIGDKGAKAYDIEVWSPGEQRYLEISTCSNFEAFQARRVNVKYREAQGSKPEFVHTLNGSGLAFPRLVVALLETGLQEDGTVKLPVPLHHYMGTDTIRGE